MSKIACVLSFLLLLTGCASVRTEMEHPQTHQKQECRAWGWGVIGAPLALLARYECVQNLKKAGYVEVKN